MKIPGSDSTSTRAKLLAVACELFAEKGYRHVTNAQICRQAGTNIAAINYHFGSKESLYREAWRQAFKESIEANPPEGGVPETAPPEERLRAQVTALVLRLTDRNNRAYSFLYREYANPTGLMDLIRQEIKPIQQRTRKLIRELLGPLPSEQEVLYCETAIIGQCTNPMLVHGKVGQQNGGKGGQPLIEDVEAYARYVVEFSLAGLAAVRRMAEARQTKGKGEAHKKGNHQEAEKRTA
jgi:AcrR family transcriptional regulator